ncbi:MAG: hypothetical protein AB9873_07570 [Syntrophobacteraceae bacterium]
MGRTRAVVARVMLVMLVGFLCSFFNASAQDKSDLTGWEKDSAYNKYYNVSEYDDFKGVVEEIIEITPLSGMAPGVGLKVRDQDKEMVEVQLGPKAFVKVDGLGFKKGDKVKVKGVWAAIGGKDVFLASKVKKGEDVEAKMRRTKDGVPYWTLTPEELAKEKSE